MTARILDGKAIAAEIRGETAQQTADWIAKGGKQPCLAAVLVGSDPASEVYVRNKQRACERAGIDSQLHRLDASTSQAELIAVVERLNNDPHVDGILVQLPLPAGLDEREVLDVVAPMKDVDAFSPENVGLLVQGRPRFLPCTPHGVVQLLKRCEIPVPGKHVVVIGRSDIVGKPMALLLAARDGSCGPEAANATVTIAHSQSDDLEGIVRSGDIIVAAVGRPEMVRGSWLKPGAVVIDVGINRVGDRLVGDVHFEEASAVASAITPVPGGVGPLTIAMLLQNTLMAAKLKTGEA
ncbi:Tetrahydrofolate dehydrogenase/cyclohydrolase [Rosistilla oblonga]|uniref:Bifunctional protein FolD n=2 Tax=Rosistilla TaxID=2795779 RepID=A0A518IYS4_9BACT|nr:MULTISPECIES: bifunctional methylenetetrahydrofolate dehydrogenase/methenyltetrahydrofolate cyclohydrolase FolD [Rosistilla]QDS89435.1 Tetrahydrofolate dehydrogenase/cyclohydrolase [Rosistilla ulvae]QDV13562.1 Tetrahydrofolate dehydrogenase/cyclohydrolase [Rosistilla oblonga]QDV58246.1 Tetrahydrofolate dehydrogenase/cyclohydrolase [Rosistilla oblonga]